MEMYASQINNKKKKKWIKWLVIILIALVLIAGWAVLWRAEDFLNKISINKSGILESLIHTIPGIKDEIKGEKEGRINILLLGMRGENIPGGGLLADTIMVVSVNLKENKAAMISIPRDFYVDNPIRGRKTKINEVYAAGEENGKKGGLESMEKTVGDVLGIPIHYGISINFAGFKQLVDAIGGIEITLDKPFSETLQFRGLEKRCDKSVFTVPSGKFESKKVTRKDKSFYFKEYPLCYAKINPSEMECGGNFSLPAGTQALDGDKTLCYARSRVNSNDFERMKRQQLIVQLIRNKLLNLGTLTDFEKVGAIMNALGDNLRIDMQLWEMKRVLEIYQEQKSKDVQIIQRILENSEEGLLYHPSESNGNGYILLPIGDNYDRIQDMARNIFNMQSQSNAKPK